MFRLELWKVGDVILSIEILKLKSITIKLYDFFETKFITIFLKIILEYTIGIPIIHIY